MSNELLPAIAALERRLEDIEGKAAEIRRAINILCEEANLPVRYSDDDSTNSSKLSQIMDDTFYGKPQQTAIREYLEMRRAQGSGPAKPRDIFDALTAGGYKFEAKDDGVALVGLRAVLRKRSNVFHKLPNGSYGLLSWYPTAKEPKPDGTASGNSEEAINNEAPDEPTSGASDTGGDDESPSNERPKLDEHSA